MPCFVKPFLRGRKSDLGLRSERGFTFVIGDEDRHACAVVRGDMAGELRGGILASELLLAEITELSV